MTDKTLILVIGCHRSGTSAVAGSLAQMGVALGDGLLGPAFDNPKGFFESRAVVAIHDRLLAENGGSWDNPPTIKRGRVAADEKLAAFIHELPGPVCTVKDPRASLCVDVWRAACQAEGVRLCVLHVWRDDNAVVDSLRRREGWGKRRARDLVRQYAAAIDAAERREPWALMEFPGDLYDVTAWHGVFNALGLEIEPNMNAVRAFMDERLIHHGQQSPPLWTAIIPSRDDKKVLGCVGSLIERHPDIRPDQIVIVSDGLSLRTRWQLRDVTWVNGKRPFNFSRAINMGARAASPASDLVILGDDVRLETPLALDWLAAASNGAAAVAAEVSGVCGQPAQRAGSTEARADWLAFICTYIPRGVWNEVGELDERFVGYGYDDVDWCRRAQGHGSLRVAHHVKAVHLSDSSYRNRDDWMTQYNANRVLFEQKWHAPMEVA